jgi:hypothetical protein
MNGASAHPTPALGVVAANDDDLGRQTQIAQGTMKPHRLLGLVLDLRLDDKKADIAVGTSLSSSVRAEHDHLRVRSGRSEATTRLGHESLGG